MRKRAKRGDCIGGLALAGQAMHLLRRAPLSLWLVYFFGTAPFCIGLLYFWADMSRSAFADQRCFLASLALAGLFIWMKSWHALFAALLREHVGAYGGTPWTPRRCLSLVAVQTVVQPLGLLAIPVALVLAFPFSVVMSFYQNVTVLGNGLECDVRKLVSKAWKQAMLWPKQSHVLIWLASPWVLGITMLCAFSIMWVVAHAFPEMGAMQNATWFLLSLGLTFYIAIPLCPVGCVVSGNIAILLAAAPMLSRKLLGIETVFSLSGMHGMLNTTFLMTVFVLTYACLDPIVKAAYVLRCFYGESLLTGRDLLVDLGAARRKLGLLLVVAVMFVGGVALAEGIDSEPSPATVVRESDAVAMDLAIRDTLEKPEYSWRMTRQMLRADELGEEGVLESFFNRLRETLQSWVRAMGRHIERFFDWLRELFRRDRSQKRSFDLDWHNSIRVLLFGVLALVAALLAVLAYRIWRSRRTRVAGMVTAVAAPPPDLEDEQVTADQLPPNQWFELAQELLQKGEKRLAMRALFLGMLAELALRERIGIAAYKSNRDYLREMERRAHDTPDAITAFRDNTTILEGVWYGAHAITDGMLAAFQSNMERAIA
jgi:hypothetical protein